MMRSPNWYRTAMALSLIADWTILGEHFIRFVLFHHRRDLLPIAKESLVASCLFGGPLAIATPTADTGGDAWMISICAADGRSYGRVSASTVQSIHWSRCQKLIVVSPTGRVLLYDPHGNLLNSFTMGEETHEFGVDEARTFACSGDTGLAILNAARQIYAVNSVNNPVLWRLTNLPVLKEPPSCWEVLANTKPTLVLLCYETRFYTGIVEERAELCLFEWVLSNGRYVGARQSPSNSLLALVHNSGIVQIVRNTDLNSLLHSIPSTYSPSPSSTSPSDILWCGESPVAIGMLSVARTSVDFYSPPGDKCTISLPSAALHLTPEVDGLRAFSNDAVYFLSPVGEASQHVLGLTSSEPGALLFEANLKLRRRDSTFYDYVKLIEGAGEAGMVKAVEQCLEAAMEQFDVSSQKALIEAAMMGRALCNERGGQRAIDNNKFHLLARELRIGNNLRQFGLAMTNREVRALTIPTLVDRLAALRLWPLAMKVCDLMETPAQSGVHRVLTRWCLEIMKAFKEGRGPASEAELGLKIQRVLARLEPAHSGVNYADIADVAARQELKQLASLLLDKEPNLARQVTLLLKLKEGDRALAKAAQSQQPDLMHLVLRHMRQGTEDSGGLEMRLRHIPQALDLYRSLMREEAPDKTLCLYEQNDDFTRQAIYHLSKAKENFEGENLFDTRKASAALSKAEKALQTMKDQSGAQLVASSSRLMADNAGREERHLTSLVEKSLRETFIWAVASRDEACVEALKKQHRLDEKQIWRWTVEGLAQGGHWQQLEQFGRAKRSPMGHLPLIDACCRHGNRELAVSLLDKITGYEEQIKAYLRVGEITKAASLAASRQDQQQLQMMRSKFLTSSEEHRQISSIMQSQPSVGSS